MTGEVEAEVRKILGKLSTLSEVSAAGYEPRSTKSAPESSVPKGVNEKANLTLATERPPSKDRDLVGFWAWRFGKAVIDDEGDFAIANLVLLAQRDYNVVRFREPNRHALRSGQNEGGVFVWACPTCGRKQEIKPHVHVAPLCSGDDESTNPARRHPSIEMEKSADGALVELAAAKRIVDLYEGVPANEVAVHEYTTEPAVKKARRSLGRQPHDGRPRAEFLDWPDERRATEVGKLHARGMGQKTAAKRLGVDHKTVARYWPAAEAIAA